MKRGNFKMKTSEMTAGVMAAGASWVPIDREGITC